MKTATLHETLRPRALGAAALSLLAMTFGTSSPAHAGGPEVEATEAEAPAAVSAETTEAAERDYQLRIRMIGIGAFSEGDTAQFQQRNRIPDGISGGIDEFFYETEIAEDTELELDGRAIFDNHDYLLRLRILNEDKGNLDVGYRQFRTWYDGRGGYFPLADASYTVFDPKLGIDRGEAWANGTVLLPSGFKLSMGYRYLSRDGSKNSIEWGDAYFPGVLPTNTQRDIVPAFYQIDEQRHQAHVEIARATDRSEVGAAVRYEHTDIENDRNVTRSPGSATAERRFTQTDDSDSDMVVAHTYGTGRFFDDKLTISGAYAYNDLELSLGGSRIYGATFKPSFDPNFPNRQQRDEGFFDLTGMTEMREHIANVSMLANVGGDFQVLSALRIRGESRHGHADFIESNVGGSPTFTTTVEELQTRSDTEELSFAEDLEVRYRGIENVVLYARALWEENDSNLFEEEIEPVLAVVDLQRKTDIGRLLQKYATGAKVYPARWISLSAEYAYRLSDYDYEHPIDSTPNTATGPTPSGDRYPAFLASQTFATHNLSLRTTLRLPADVTAVVRYDWLQSTIDTRADELDEIESGQTRAHMVGATVTYNPVPWWWVRQGANYTHSTTDTSANDYPTPVAGLFPSFDNDYLTLSSTMGLALDAATELELGYIRVSADNFHDKAEDGRPLSTLGLSYGSRFEENNVAARVTRRLGENTKIGGGYSYLSNDESFAGGDYDYHAHIIFTTVEFEY